MKKLILTFAILLASCWTDSDDVEQENTVEPAGVAKKTIVAVSFNKGRCVSCNAKASIRNEIQALAKVSDDWSVVDSASGDSKSSFNLIVPDTASVVKVCASGVFENEFSRSTEEITDGVMCSYVIKEDSVKAVNLIGHMIYMAVAEAGGYTDSIYDVAEAQVLKDFETSPSAITAGYRDDAGLGVLLGVSNIAVKSRDYSIFRDSTRSVMRYSRYFEDLVSSLKDTSDAVTKALTMASDTSLLAYCDIGVDKLMDDIYLNIEPLNLSNDSAVRTECKQYVSKFVYGVDYNDSTLAVFDWLVSEDYGHFRAYRTFQEYPDFCGDWNESVNGLAGHINCYQKMLDAREL